MLQFELLFKNLNQRKSIDIVIKCVMGFIKNVMSRAISTQKNITYKFNAEIVDKLAKF